MFDRLISPKLRANTEFHSALVRLGIWVYAASYIGLGALSDYYRVSLPFYVILVATYLVVFLGILASVIHSPGLVSRRYLTIAIDVSASSLAILLTGDAINPFYLLYIWIFLSYGTRYGQPYLLTASVLSVIAYGIVLTVMNAWQEYGFEAVFFLLTLVVLPFYQHVLLRRLRETHTLTVAADRARSDLLEKITNEIHTPLDEVIRTSKLLESKPLTPQRRAHLDSLKTSTNRLQSLIDGLRDLSKMGAGKLVLEPRAFDLHAAIQEVCTSLSKQAHDKQLELVCHLDPQLPRQFVGDELRIRQVLGHLIGNGIKFTDKGEVVVHAGFVQTSIVGDAQRFELEVASTDIGIPQEKLSHVFESFWQADPSTTHCDGGSGLGTTIARDLARLMGGDIEAVSQSGKGGSFRLTLPLPLPLAQAASPPLVPESYSSFHALVLEESTAARDALLNCCHVLGISSQPVRTEDQLYAIIMGRIEAGQPIDVVIISDSPKGRDLRAVSDRIRSSATLPVIYLAYGARSTPCGSKNEICVPKPVYPETLYQAVAAVASDKPTARDAASAQG